ncbi:hypothetical protein N7517_002654 [Penicillium concentricum]|uniref:Uncharacterized protein n=1 Tax=Penicillium concentricum TaxID=293559 RepID=A0A9W9VJQ6_9EURO|nr:uncharacterized protein N7517_002654 [Penicillium concentricum]KAJ5384743.1 hypothetical protein N7517_002654 [Penicillium concentricum]
MQRPLLHRWLAIRSSHGDFDWYHRRFNHEDARLSCSCGINKRPEHIALCRLTKRRFQQWPRRPSARPSNKREAVAYLKSLEP